MGRCRDIKTEIATQGIARVLNVRMSYKEWNHNIYSNGKVFMTEVGS